MTNVFFVLEKAGTPPKAIFESYKGAEDYIEAEGGRDKYYIEQWATWRSYADLQLARDTIAQRGEL